MRIFSGLDYAILLLDNIYFCERLFPEASLIYIAFIIRGVGLCLTESPKIRELQHLKLWLFFICIQFAFLLPQYKKPQWNSSLLKKMNVYNRALQYFDFSSSARKILPNPPTPRSFTKRYLLSNKSGIIRVQTGYFVTLFI